MHLKLRYSVLFILLYLAYVISVFTAMFSGNKYSIDHMLLSMLTNYAVFFALVRPILKLELFSWVDLLVSWTLNPTKFSGYVTSVFLFCSANKNITYGAHSIEATVNAIILNNSDCV